MKNIVICQSVSKILFMALALFIMVSCSEEAMVEKPASTGAEAVVEVVEEADVASLTVSGIFTEVTPNIDCASCTYKVPANVKSVDGSKLNLKPGSVVCVSGGRKLGEIEFVNMVGTEKDPIIIGTCND